MHHWQIRWPITFPICSGMKSRKSIIISIATILTGIMAMISCKQSSSPAPEVSFNKDIIPIFTAYCTLNSNCHAGANSFNLQTDFDSSIAYNTLISRGLISTGNPSSSLLYVEVSGTGIAEMPKPPLPALSASQQSLILDWIEQGAKNN